MAKSRKLPAWSGPERWEKTHEGQEIWLEIRPSSATMRTLRNELGDVWLESIPDVELRRKQLWSTGNMLVKLEGPRGGRPSHPPLEQAILETALALGRGNRNLPVRLTTLRARVQRVFPHHRTDFDEAIRRLHEARKVVLSRDDNTAQVTADDREDAVWVGDQPRHVLYLES